MTSNYILVPKKDITAYELAQCLNLVLLNQGIDYCDPAVKKINQQLTDVAYECLQDCCKRHFMVIERGSLSAVFDLLNRIEQENKKDNNEQRTEENQERREESHCTGTTKDEA